MLGTSPLVPGASRGGPAPSCGPDEGHTFAGAPGLSGFPGVVVGEASTSYGEGRFLTRNDRCLKLILSVVLQVVQGGLCQVLPFRKC